MIPPVSYNVHIMFSADSHHKMPLRFRQGLQAVSLTESLLTVIVDKYFGSLLEDLVEEILSKVPITSLGAVRCTCKGWNALSKARILCKAEPKEQFLGFMMKDGRLCSMRFDLQGIHNEDDEEFVDPSIKEIGNFLNHVEILNVYQCDGLLLCVTMDNSRLVIWNPYLGQTKWIQLKTETESTYALGYDKNKNHKILRFFDDDQGNYEIYDVKSSSWRTFSVIPKWDIDCDMLGESVDGNTYFWTRERIVAEGYDETSCFLICFDFTVERFGQFLSLPFQHLNEASGTFSCVKEEKLIVLYHYDTSSMIEIWVSTKIEPNAVSWTPFLKVDVEPLFGLDIQLDDPDNSIFIDVEKKLAVVFDLDYESNEGYKTATSYMIKDNGHLKKVNLGKIKACSTPVMCPSCYVPSLVQIDDPVVRRSKRERNQHHQIITQ